MIRNKYAQLFARWAVLWMVCVSTLAVPQSAAAQRPPAYQPSLVTAENTTNETTATDGQVLTTNANGTYTFETPSGTGLATPDGLTTVGQSPEYPLTSYFSARPTDQIYECTTSGAVVTLRDDAGTAVGSHDFIAGQEIAIGRAGGATDCATPTVTANYAHATPATDVTVTVNTSTEQITTSSALSLATETPVYFHIAQTGSTLVEDSYPGGITERGILYVRQLTSTTYTLHPTAADATANTNIVNLTGSISGTMYLGVGGATTWTYGAAAVDAEGGISNAASFATTTGPATLSASTYLRVRIPIPANAKGVLLYGRGGSGRKLLNKLPATPIKLFSLCGADSFSAIATAGGGSQITITVSSGHNYSINDIVNVNCGSGATDDTAYDGQWPVVGVTTSTITVTRAFDAGAGTATGTVSIAAIEWLDKGDAVARHKSNYLPDMVNPPLRWRADTRHWVGQTIAETATDRIWEVTKVTSDELSGTTEPTWTTGTNAEIWDTSGPGNALVWRRGLEWSPVAEPTAAIPKIHHTTVASVTSSTVTLTDAPVTAIGSSVLVVSHNNARAMRAAVAAAKTAGGGTVVIPDGPWPVILPGTVTNTNYWTDPDSGINYAFLHLKIADRPTTGAVNIRAGKSALIRVRTLIADARVDGGDADTNQLTSLICDAQTNWQLTGGTWELWSCPGVLEYDNAVGSSAGTRWTFRIADADASVHNSSKWTLENANVFFNSLADDTGSEVAGVSSAVQSVGHVQIRNCDIRYGGCDGDGGILPHGGFVCLNTDWTKARRNGSISLYLNIGKWDILVDGGTHKWIDGVGKPSIQMRGSGGDTRGGMVTIANLVLDASNQMYVGDSTTSNQWHRVDLINLKCINGTDGSRSGGVTLTECRHVNVIGGDISTLAVSEDCEDVSVTGARIHGFNFQGVNGSARNFACSNIVCDFLEPANVDSSTFSNFTFLNPYEPTASHRNTLVEYIATGVSDEYYCRLDATDGDPSITTPAGVAVRDRASYVAGTPGSLGPDTWAYVGLAEVQRIMISGTPTGGDFTVTYNGNTSGAIAYNASAATVQTALRLVTGLGSVTVAQIGASPNVINSVTMTGVAGDPVQMTATDSTTGGTHAIAIATTMPYLGFNTLLIKMGDSQSYDPDGQPLNSVESVRTTLTSGGLGVSSSVNNCLFENFQFTNSNGRTTPLFGSSVNASAASTRGVTFRNFKFFYSGQALTSSCRPIDFGSSERSFVETVFEGIEVSQPTQLGNVAFSPMRLTAREDSTITIKGFRAPYMFGSDNSSGLDVCQGNGRIKLIDCELGGNQQWVFASAASDNLTYLVAESGSVATTSANETSITLASTANATDDYYNGSMIHVTYDNGSQEDKEITDYVGASKLATIKGSFRRTPTASGTTSTTILQATTYTIPGALVVTESNGQPLQLYAPYGTFPNMTWNAGANTVAQGQVVYQRGNNPMTLHPTPADAIANTNQITWTTTPDVTLQAVTPGLASDARLVNNEPLANNNDVSDIVYASGNTFYGSASWKYAQVTAAQNNFGLMPVDVHLLNTDASRAITGFANGWEGRRALVVNDGGFDLVFTNDSASSLWNNQFQTHTGADVTDNAGESTEFVQDATNGWRTIGN